MNSDFQKAYILSRIKALNLCPGIPEVNLALMDVTSLRDVLLPFEAINFPVPLSETMLIPVSDTDGLTVMSKSPGVIRRVRGMCV